MKENCNVSLWSKGTCFLCDKQDQLSGKAEQCCCPLGFSMLFISAVCIGIGLLALIGASWGSIPNIIKIIFYLALLAANIYGVYKSLVSENAKLKESLLVVLSIVLLAGINLFSDIFNLPVMFYDTLLIWCVLNIPLLCMTKKSLLSIFWIPLFLMSMTSFMSRFALTDYIINLLHLQAPGLMMWIIAFALLLISVSRGQTSAFGRAANFWFIGTLTLNLLMNEIFQDVGFYSYGIFLRDLLFTPSEYCWIYWVACSVALSIFIFKDKNGKYNGSTVALLIMILFNYIAAYTPLIFIPNFGLMAAICTLAILITALVRTITLEKNGLSKFLLGLICLRIVLIYWQDFGSLALTGFGLICAGVIFVWIAKQIERQENSAQIENKTEDKMVSHLNLEEKKKTVSSAKSKAPAKKAPAPKKKVVKKEKKTTKK